MPSVLIKVMRQIVLVLKRCIVTTKNHDETIRRRESVLVVLFGITLGVLFLSVIALCLSAISGYDPFVLNRLTGLIAALLVVLLLYTALRKGYFLIAAAGLLGIYALLAITMAIQWSVNLPSVLLLLCVVIVVSGMALGARYSLYVTLGSMVALGGVEYMTVTGRLRPDTAWRYAPTHFPDLFAYFLAFITLGLCSWLFNRQTDLALYHAHQADRALQHEKKLLEIKVEERTRALQAAQMEKMQQLYRFAQLGQFSTSLLHDLANHLTTMSLDIEGMREQYEQTEIHDRVSRRIQYIDDTIRWAYNHINGKVQERTFSVRREVREVIAILRYDARQQHVTLHSTVKPTGPLTMYGDPNRFRQIIANLISNAIDAYEDKEQISRVVTIEIDRQPDSTVTVAVRDYGIGIPKEARAKIFEPFYSTKYDGMGIGLFMVRQIVEEHFHGHITLEAVNGETIFQVTLPDRERSK
ncbi:MAG TPA: HAMP domain-containing sensor histidine kinase [Verrucomicrobiae bacterium]|nr:HAMP domain-containing sensor histidine kinase [Verrucomicrobiae bacterium]